MITDLYLKTPGGGGMGDDNLYVGAGHGSSLEKRSRADPQDLTPIVDISKELESPTLRKADMGTKSQQSLIQPNTG